MERIRALTAAACVTVTLAACGSTGGSVSPAAAKDEGADTPKKTVPAAKSPSVLIFDEGCINTPYRVEALPLLGFLVPILAQLGSAAAGELTTLFLGEIAEYLEKRAAQLTASSTATYNLEAMYKEVNEGTAKSYKPTIGCLIFFRGGWQETEPMPKRVDGAKVWTNLEITRINELLKRKKIALQLKRAPEVYAEFAVIYENVTLPESKGKIESTTGSGSTAKKIVQEITLPKEVVPMNFGLKPVYLDYGISGTARNPRDAKKLIFDVEMVSRIPGKSQAAILSTVFDLGEVKPGTVLKPEDLAHKSFPLQPIPLPTIAQIDRGGIKREFTSLVPTTTTVILTESEDGGDIERLVAKIIRDKRKAVSDAVAKEVDERIKKLSEEKEKDK